MKIQKMHQLIQARKRRKNKIKNTPKAKKILKNKADKIKNHNNLLKKERIFKNKGERKETRAKKTRMKAVKMKMRSLIEKLTKVEFLKERLSQKMAQVNQDYRVFQR